DRGVQVRLAFSEGEVALSAGGDDAAQANETLPVEFVGAPLTIAFNPGYLLDGLGSIHSSRVAFGFTQPSRPAVLRPAPEELPEPDAAGAIAPIDSDRTSLLMPVRLPGWRLPPAAPARTCVTCDFSTTARGRCSSSSTDPG